VASRLAECCFERGLIVRALPAGTTMAFSPPLCITREEVDVIVDTFARALGALADELTRGGIRLGS
jgi:L-2,4-diaminobutyrate transaminase